HLLAYVRRQRVEQLDERVHGAVPRRVARASTSQVVLHRVRQLHQKRDRGVEPQLVVMLRDLAHGLGDLAAQCDGIDGRSKRAAASTSPASRRTFMKKRE